MLILNSGYRQVTLHQTSKNSSRPSGREPSELLALGVNIGGIRIERTRAESSSYIYKYEREQHSFRWLIKWLIVPCGRAAPVQPHPFD